MEGRMKKNLAILAVLVGVFLPAGSGLLAQNVPGPQLMKQDEVRKNAIINDSPRLLSDPDIQSLRRDLRSQRKQIFAANMSLTDTEAEKFWPVYDRYAEDLAKINDTKVALLMEYAQGYDAMTDEQAKDYVQRRAAVEQLILELRQKYVPLFGRVLTGKETALFFQIEWRLSLLVDLQLAQMPLID